MMATEGLWARGPSNAEELSSFGISVVLPLLLIAVVLGCGSRADDVNSPRGDDTGLSPFNCNEDPFIEPFMRGVIETLAQEEWEGRKFDSDGGSASWPADFSAAPVSCL